MDEDDYGKFRIERVEAREHTNATASGIIYLFIYIFAVFKNLRSNPAQLIIANNINKYKIMLKEIDIVMNKYCC